MREKKIIFDLNKTLADDMLEIFNQTGDIKAVNEKFGVQLTDFKYGLPIPNIDPKIKGV